MGGAWSSCTELVLCEDPSLRLPYTGSPIGLLEAFATNLPSLEALGYFCNSDIGVDVQEVGGHIGFGHLKKLKFGLSSVPHHNVESVGLFLGSLCSESIEIDCERSSGNAEEIDEDDPEERERVETWARVEKLARASSAPFRKLQNEVAEWRMLAAA